MKKNTTVSILLTILLLIIFTGCSLSEQAELAEKKPGEQSELVNSLDAIKLLKSDVIIVKENQPELTRTTTRTSNLKCHLKVTMVKVKFYRDLDTWSRGDAYFDLGVQYGELSGNSFYVYYESQAEQWPSGKKTKQVHKGNTYTYNKTIVDVVLSNVNPNIDWFRVVIDGWDKDGKTKNYNYDDHYGLLDSYIQITYDPNHPENNVFSSTFNDRTPGSDDHIKIWYKVEAHFFY